MAWFTLVGVTASRTYSTVVLLTIGIVKRHRAASDAFFLPRAAFFAFHLLFSYLVDQVSIHAAFAIAAVTSLALVISYLRVVVGSRFALYARVLRNSFTWCYSPTRSFSRGLPGSRLRSAR